MTTALGIADASTAFFSLKKRPLQLREEAVPEAAGAITANSSDGGSSDPVALPLRRHSLLLQLNKTSQPSYSSSVSSASASLLGRGANDKGNGRNNSRFLLPSLASPAMYDTDSEEEDEDDDDNDEGEEQGREKEDARLPFKKRRCHSSLHDSSDEEERGVGPTGAGSSKPKLAAAATLHNQPQPQSKTLPSPANI